MPHYYFNLRNSISVDDDEGARLPDLEAAIGYASEQARELVAANAVEEGTIDLDHRIEIVDKAGTLLATVLFGDVVRVTRAGRPVPD